MFDKLLALVSIASFAGFVGILIYYVPEPDLVVVCVAVVLMAFFDFFLLTRTKPKDGADSSG
jgi:hypothetical protein